MIPGARAGPGAPASRAGLPGVLALLGLLLLAACGGRELAEEDYDEADEIPSGPGLLSGEDGAWTIGTD